MAKRTSAPLSHDAQLMKLARHVARLEGRARELRGALKRVTSELKARKRELKGYAQSVADHKWNEQAPPMRTFGEH